MEGRKLNYLGVWRDIVTHPKVVVLWEAQKVVLFYKNMGGLSDCSFISKNQRFWFFQMNHEHRARVRRRDALHEVGVTPLLHVVRPYALL
jgi:hypothetical protein